MISRILFITCSQIDAPKGGRAMLSSALFETLNQAYPDSILSYRLTDIQIQGIRAKLNALRGFINGISHIAIKDIFAIIERETVNLVFIDGSNLGLLTKILRARFTESIIIVTFFHNVEARFFWGKMRNKFNIRSIFVVLANFFSERKAVIWSNKIISLSNRDSLLLKRLYGRGATHILPIFLRDCYMSRPTTRGRVGLKPFALFVGGDFYANRAGIFWFVKNVMPLVNLRLCIVGYGFESLRKDLESVDGVVVIGAVNDLAEWYLNAQFVVAPIFDGSGMKTKIAEALMYGKKVIGTPEAFSGYEIVTAQVGCVCRDAKEFSLAIREAQINDSSDFDHSLRKIFLRHYSLSAAELRLKEILH